MAYSFLSLDMNLIPSATKYNVPNFWQGKFSDDELRMLIPGRDIKTGLVHSNNSLLSLLQWEPNPQATLDLILRNSIEYTQEQYETLLNDVDSIWYVARAN